MQKLTAKKAVKKSPPRTGSSKGGRPTKYCDQIAAEICGRLSCGEPVSTICKDDHMPGVTTIFMWLRRHDEFRKDYEEARKNGAHTYADQIAQIIDTKPLEIVDEQGNVRYDSASIAWNRLRMDGRKWLAAKYLPKVYGERLGVEGVEDGVAIKTEDATFAKLSAILSNMEMKKRAGES
jgi:hypothetical protein